MIRLDDDWVRDQLMERLSLLDKLKYIIKRWITSEKRFYIPLIPSVLQLSLFYELLSEVIRKEIRKEMIFPGHSKILESQGLSSVARNLQNIVDRLPDFQAFIYATDEFYRDHIEHQIRVAVLGNFLLSQQFRFDTQVKRLVDIISANMAVTEDKVRKAWWIASLFHDIGIPVSKLAEVFNNVIKSDLSEVYHSLDLKVSDIKDPIPDWGKNQPFFEILTKNLPPSTRDSLEMGLGWTPSRKTDHGAFSALLLLTSIPGITELEPKEIENRLENEYQSYLIAAQAVALHNVYQNENCIEIKFHENPLAYMLVVCDEIQEWNRDVNVKERKGLLDPKFRKVQLLKHCFLQLSETEIQVFVEFRDQNAKDLCHFIFDDYVVDKQKNVNRLRNDKKIFPDVSITLTDFVFEEDRLMSKVPLIVTTKK